MVCVFHPLVTIYKSVISFSLKLYIFLGPSKTKTTTLAQEVVNKSNTTKRVLDAKTLPSH